MPETQTPRPPIDCRQCEGSCCRYFALQLDTPETPEDFDHLRWYMAHQQVAIFIEKKDWYLQVNTTCRFLQPDHSCGHYEQRPQICREYGWDEEGKPDCHGTDQACDHDEFFSTLEELEAYLIRKKLAWASQKSAC
jgi:Fe-S-cluster containining protein